MLGKNYISKYLKLLSLVCVCLYSNAQKKITVNIKMPQTINIDTANIHIYFDDGRNNKEVTFTFKQNKFIFVDNLYAKYGTVTIYYNGNSFSLSGNNNFWVDTEKATIIFDNKNNELDKIEIYKLINAYDLNVMGQQKLNDYINSEKNDLKKFTDQNSKWFTTDSLTIIFHKKNIRISDKKIDFVKNNSDMYFSFWLFRRELIYAHTNIDSLLKIYDTIFPKKFKQGLEEKEILKVLNGRNLKKNIQAPDFTIEDITEKSISLSKEKGKYVLLNFWSTTCGPCIAELPTIVQFRNYYSEDKLTIISVSSDTDSNKFLSAIKKYDMNWINIFGNIDDLFKTYGVRAIPQLFLIDDKGLIIYSRDEEQDFDSKLIILKKVLEEKLFTTKK